MGGAYEIFEYVLFRAAAIWLIYRMFVVFRQEWVGDSEDG
jgi:hypothetical protein